MSFLIYLTCKSVTHSTVKYCKYLKSWKLRITFWYLSTSKLSKLKINQIGYLVMWLAIPFDSPMLLQRKHWKTKQCFRLLTPVYRHLFRTINGLNVVQWIESNQNKSHLIIGLHFVASDWQKFVNELQSNDGVGNVLQLELETDWDLSSHRTLSDNKNTTINNVWHKDTSKKFFTLAPFIQKLLFNTVNKSTRDVLEYRSGQNRLTLKSWHYRQKITRKKKAWDILNSPHSWSERSRLLGAGR